jgi:RimJ/RimL family protein N-acetyltransferase
MLNWTQFGAVEVLGPAALLFASAANRAAGPAFRIDPRDQGVAALLELVPAEEAAEAGIDELTYAFAVTPDGQFVAVAGYQVWPGGIAHLAVLSAPGYRRNGHARAAATAAVVHALDSGLLPQWRARLLPSQRLALSLGLQPLGAQAGVLLSR